MRLILIPLALFYLNQVNTNKDRIISYIYISMYNKTSVSSYVNTTFDTHCIVGQHSAPVTTKYTEK